MQEEPSPADPCAQVFIVLGRTIHVNTHSIIIRTLFYLTHWLGSLISCMLNLLLTYNLAVPAASQLDLFALAGPLGIFSRTFELAFLNSCWRPSIPMAAAWSTSRSYRSYKAGRVSAQRRTESEGNASRWDAIKLGHLFNCDDSGYAHRKIGDLWSCSSFLSPRWSRERWLSVEHGCALEVPSRKPKKD